MHDSLIDLFRSPCFWSAFMAWFLAQLTKTLSAVCRDRRLDFRYLVSLGGMPSAHSAMVIALATAVGLEMGFGHPVFVVTLAFALIVMLEAATVRRAAGTQARLLNEMVGTLFREHRLSEEKLVELLGHTRLEVFMGMLMGIFMALLVKAVAVVF
jgi:acid phosphatase family membrane protein YuiD